MRKVYRTIQKNYSVKQKSFFWLPRIITEAVSYRVSRPVVKYIRYHSGDVYPVCPRCNCGLDREYTAFCDRCGQRLGWYAINYADVVGLRRETPLQMSDDTISDTQYPEHINWRSHFGQNSIGK